MHSRPHKTHAERIVKQFREQLGDSLAKKVGDDHLNDLAVMIESALNTTVLDALNQTVGEIETLAQRTAKRAAGEL
jgi:3-deoxy-D-manno-octulosonate 8-phosphate phosphatase KdsC-like HAD superfamily phosphatase